MQKKQTNRRQKIQKLILNTITQTFKDLLKRWRRFTLKLSSDLTVRYKRIHPTTDTFTCLYQVLGEVESITYLLLSKSHQSMMQKTRDHLDSIHEREQEHGTLTKSLFCR